MNTKKVYCSLGKIQNALECAYSAAWRAMKLAEKLKQAAIVRNKPTRIAAAIKHRSRIMGAINRIRAELKRFAKLNWPLFDTLVYSGVVVNLLHAPVIHSRFIREA